MMPRESSKAKSSEAGGSCSSSRRCEKTGEWLQRIHEAHTSRMPPERREQLKRKAETSRLRVQQAKKCKAIRSHNERSHMLAHEGLRQMASSSARGAHAHVADRWMSALVASEDRQDRKMAKIEASKRAAAPEVEEDESSDEEEAVAEMAALVGSADVSMLTAGGGVAAAAGAAAGAGAAGGIEELLQQVRTEPKEAAECAAKFGIYEGYSGQLVKIRKSLFDFYEETGSTLPDAVSKQWQRQLKKIDSADNMSILDGDRRVWFVYHMMKAAERNNRSMRGVLEDFQRKTEMLAKNDQAECPVCLDDFTESGGECVPVTLSCCHKICEQCWEHWKQVTRGHPFCPLCRNEEFLDIVARRVR